MADYKDKYERALRIMNDYARSPECSIVSKRVIEEAFPEVAELDERQVLNEILDLAETAKAGGYDKFAGKKYNFSKWIPFVKKFLETPKQKFIVGDIIKTKIENPVRMLITAVEEDSYRFMYLDNFTKGKLDFKYQDKYELAQ